MMKWKSINCYIRTFIIVLCLIVISIGILMVLDYFNKSHIYTTKSFNNGNIELVVYTDADDFISENEHSLKNRAKVNNKKR